MNYVSECSANGCLYWCSIGIVGGHGLVSVRGSSSTLGGE